MEWVPRRAAAEVSASLVLEREEPPAISKNYFVLVEAPGSEPVWRRELEARGLRLASRGLLVLGQESARAE